MEPPLQSQATLPEMVVLIDCPSKAVVLSDTAGRGASDKPLFSG